MIRLTAGNDTPFIWAVKLQGQPFDLSGKDVKVYVINSRGEIPVASLNIEGNIVSGVFEGRYQTRLGMHSLALRVNEGRPEMKTATVANAFELVEWSADAGGSEAGDVIFAPVVITSELRIGTGGGGEGGGSYDDTAIWKAVNNKVDKVVGKGLSTNDYTNAEKSKLAGLKNYDDTQIKKDIEGLSKKIEGLEPGGPGTSYDDTEIRNAITGLEQSKANKPILISIEALGTPAHLNDKDVAMYWSKEQVEAALSMTLSELYEQAQTREVIVNIMGQTLYPESTMRFEDDLIEFRYPIPTPAVSGFYVLVICQSPTDVADVNTAIMLGGQFAELATKEELTELSENVAELRHDLGECDSRAGSALDMAEKHEEQLTELSAEIGNKVDAEFVNNAIAEAITTTLNTEV